MNWHRARYGNVCSLRKECVKLAIENTLRRDQLYDAIHDVLAHQFDSRAERVVCGYKWEDLVLPLHQKTKIMECCNQVSLRHIVLEKWNMEKKQSA